METKRCPYCGEEIMAAAKKCKHCGEWLGATYGSVSSSKSSNKSEVTVENSTAKTIMMCVGGVLVLVVIIFIIALSTQKSDYEKAMELQNSSYPSYSSDYDSSNPFEYDTRTDPDYFNSNANSWD